MKAASVILVCDTREPWPHPWEPYLPPHVRLEQGTLKTGDFVLFGHPDVVIERKTVSDMLGCIGNDRERFERELQRASSLRAFCVVVEGTLQNLLDRCYRLNPQSIIGTLAAWSRRRCPVILCDNPQLAATFAWRYLAGQDRDEQLNGDRVATGNVEANARHPDRTREGSRRAKGASLLRSTRLGDLYK